MTKSQILGLFGTAALGAAAFLEFGRRRKTPEPVEAEPAIPPCIFCNNESGSREHLWPDWALRYIEKNKIDLGGLRVQQGTAPEEIRDNLEMTIDTVCRTCNNTWMGKIEQKSQPRFLLMLKNTPFVIDPGGMKVMTEWGVLKSIILDSTKPEMGGENFYTREERVAMRERREIPAQTRVWVGTLDEFHIGSHGTDFSLEAMQTDGSKVRIGTGIVNTLYMGYFVTQVIALGVGMHCLRSGAWWS